ncbi:hypothetical protein EO220_0296 [Saccharomyces cerevisiae PE-2]|nr:hypothetical protein EO220_0296 [Saccharomyces cerevisiae PE-2]CAF1544825.1 hypothetical protein C2U11_0296 [Saccharomyces cerevisiae PE-2]
MIPKNSCKYEDCLCCLYIIVTCIYSIISCVDNFRSTFIWYPHLGHVHSPHPFFRWCLFCFFFFRWRGNYKVQQVRTLTYIKLALWPQLKKQSNQRNQRRGPPGERRILTPLRGACQLICSLLMKTETLSVPRILT